MPTAATTTYAGDKLEPFIKPETAAVIQVRLTVSKTYVKGQVLGEITATPGIYEEYDDAAVDGTAVAKSILQYACSTDASGNVTFAGGELGETYKSAPAYVAGFFSCADLTGLDAAGVADLGRLVDGTSSAGILFIG